MSADAFRNLSFALAASDLNCERVVHPVAGSAAYIPMNLPGNDASVNEWAERCAAMHRDQERIADLPEKPDDKPYEKRNRRPHKWQRKAARRQAHTNSGSVPKADKTPEKDGDSLGTTLQIHRV